MARPDVTLYRELLPEPAYFISVGVQSPTEITLREDAHACGQEDDAFGIPHAARKSRKRDLNLWDREWEPKRCRVLRLVAESI